MIGGPPAQIVAASIGTIVGTAVGIKKGVKKAREMEKKNKIQGVDEQGDVYDDL